MAHISIGVSHHALRIVFTRLRLMPDPLATVQGRMDPVSVTVSGEFKHYTRMSGQGYPECHLKIWPMTSPGARY